MNNKANKNIFLRSIKTHLQTTDADRVVGEWKDRREGEGEEEGYRDR